MKSNENTVVYNTEQTAAELNKVPGFNPLKYVRNTENGAVLDLPYKKLWFRLKHPNGIIRVIIRNLSDKISAVEARVYFDRRDSEPASNHIVSGVVATDKSSMAFAQNSAIENALADAGFGIQFVPSKPNSVVKKNDIPAKIVNATTIVKSEDKANVSKKTQPTTEPEKDVVQVEETPTTEIKEDATPTVQTADAAPSVEATSTSQDTAPKTTDPLLSLVNNIENSGVKVNEETGEVVEDAPVTESEPETVEESGASDEAQSSSPTVAYDKSTPVDDICAVMTLDEAMNYVIEGGPYNGWKMSTLVERRPTKILETVVEKYPVADNILRAAAKIILQSKK